MALDHKIDNIKNNVRTYMDFPKKGIIFRDILPVFRCPVALSDLADVLVAKLQETGAKIDAIAGIEARGFLIGLPVAEKLQLPFFPIRKPGKLPGKIKAEQYTKEYGTDSIEIQDENLSEKNVAILDDLLATGGTMAAAVNLFRSCGAIVKVCVVAIELDGLPGRKAIEGLDCPVVAVLNYPVDRQ